MSVNKVILVGRLGKDPEARTGGGDTPIVKFTLATDRFGKDKENGPDWHNIVCFGRTADVVAQWCKKGRQIYVEGRIQYRRYEKDGETKYFTEVVASSVQLLGSNDGSGNGNGNGNSGGGGGRSSGGFGSSGNLDREVEVGADDCPF